MTRRALVLFALMSVIWGVPYLFIRIAVAEVSPAFLVFVRTGLAAAILLPIAIARVDLRTVLTQWRWVVAFAAVEIAVPWILLGSAEQHVSSSLAGLVIAGVPLVSAAIALTGRGADRLGTTGIAGLGVGLLGVAAIVGGDLASTDPLALVELAGVVVGYALGPAILARRLAGVPSVGVMAISMALTAVVYIPPAIAQAPVVVPSVAAIASILILAVLCTAAGFLIFAALIAEVGPVRGTVITYVNPAVAAILGVLVLHEVLTPAMIGGFVLVIVGSILATRRPKPRPTAQDRKVVGDLAPG